MFSDNRWQLFNHLIEILLVGDYKYIFGWTNRGKPPEGLLNQGFTCSKYINKLFGPRLTAKRPETGPHSASHNHTVIVFIHQYNNFSVTNLFTTI